VAFLATGREFPDFQAAMRSGSFVARLAWVNIILVVFNLLPAFPMDGGRVLRAILAVRMGRRRATQVAASIGQFMAIIFGLIGLFVAGNPFMVFVAIFVFLGAQDEARMVGMTSLMRGLTVRDAMLKRFRTLASGDPLSAAVDELLAGSQQEFPVLEGEQVVGILRRQDLVKGLAEHGKQAPVGSVMSRECPSVRVDEPLQQAFERLQANGCTAVPVLEAGVLIGFLTLENISERVMVASALEGHDGRLRHPSG